MELIKVFHSCKDSMWKLSGCIEINILVIKHLRDTQLIVIIDNAFLERRC
jgi:hypothetical protein